jgi:hypothetical protein
MLNKLISKFKTPEVVTQTPAEAAAAESISTLEKAELLENQLDAAQRAENGPSPRRELLRKQMKQAWIAVQHHRMADEKTRVAALMKADKISADMAIKAANEAYPVAASYLVAEQEKHHSIAARLVPLEAGLNKARQQVKDGCATAQKEFDAAIASGDEVAEVAAAEKLFKAEKLSNQDAPLSGPLELRIAALRRELAAADARVSAAEVDLEDASQACLKANAELALLEYDQQAQALFEAYLVQRRVVNACGDGVNLSFPKVNDFVFAVSCRDRITFNSAMHEKNGRLSCDASNEFINALTSTPNLSVLATNVNELPATPKPEMNEVGPAVYYSVNDNKRQAA